jgi:Xaa-Pro aminopeptidase
VGIGTRPAYNETKLAAGQVLSNEPGYYKPGAFGIRIENIVLVRPAEVQSEYGGPDGFLKMERVTMVSASRELPKECTAGADLAVWMY